MTRIGELSDRPHSRYAAADFRRGEPVRLVRPPEIDELSEKLIDNGLRDRRVDPRLHPDVAGVETLLPGLWRRDPPISADQFAPVHVIAERGREQAQPIAARAVDTVGVLEDRHA